MLCVHLKRFRHDLSYSSKISSPVQFPLVGLDMRPYLHKECKSEVSTYDLTAVICHHGTVVGGHYTSFAKHDLTGKWFEFDDQLVNEVSTEVVQNCEAYVLFYRKSSPQMAVVRNQAKQLDSACAEPSDIRFFVSRQWLNKFKTFAEPGPIDNWALLCPHGGLSPRKAVIASQLVVPLPQPLWEFLFKRFGGGPVCNHLFECEICRQAADSLTRRQNIELDAFSAYKDETTSTIYAISMAWFRQWQLFVGAVSDEEPGPITNGAIASSPVENNLSRGVKSGSDYAQINSTLWKFFYNIYGGGPEIILRGNPGDDFRPASNPPPDESPVDRERERERDRDQFVPHPNAHQPNGEPEKSITSTAEVHHDPIDSAAPAASSAPSAASAIATSKKVVKNVSFEGDDNSDKEVAPNSHESTNTSRRGSKHQYATNSATPNEIVSKKDRRHRGGITTNGLFGPEGIHNSKRPTDEPQVELSLIAFLIVRRQIFRPQARGGRSGRCEWICSGHEHEIGRNHTAVPPSQHQYRERFGHGQRLCEPSIVQRPSPPREQQRRRKQRRSGQDKLSEALQNQIRTKIFIVQCARK